jgi:hypothetical protein
MAANEQAARRVLRDLARGERLDPMLRRLLLDALADEDRCDRPRDPNALVSAAARSGTEWIDTPLEERAEALRELLGLADALPPQPKSGPPFVNKVWLLHEALDGARISHAFGGALAVAYYGEPRATGDIDVNVFAPAADWQQLRKVLAPLEIDIEISERELRKFNEMQVDWGLTPVHLFFSCDALHQQMHQAVRSVPFNGRVIPLVAPEHLMVRKAILDRPKDWHDIEQILVATDPLDVGEIEDWLERMVGADNPRITKLAEVKAGLSLD